MTSNPSSTRQRITGIVLSLALVLMLVLWFAWPKRETVPPEPKPHAVVTALQPTAPAPPQTPAAPAPKLSTLDLSCLLTNTPKNSAIIEGYVYRPDGTPAPNATIEAVPALSTPNAGGGRPARETAPFDAAADASGYFRIVDLPVSNYRVSAASEDGWAEEVALLGGSVDIAQVLLVLKTTGSLSGFVVDERERPVPNAHVTVLSRDGHELSPSVQRSLTSTSAEDGAFKLDRMIAAEYLMCAVAPGFAPTLADACQIDVPIHLRLAPGLRLQGKLLRRDNKRPLEGVRLVLQSSPATREDPFVVTAPDGAFAFDDLRNGGYWLYAAEGPWQLVDGSVRIEIQGSRAPESMTVLAGAAASVSGRVIEANTGAPMPGVPLSAHTPARLVLDAVRRTQSDENGQFTFQVMPLGETTFRVDSDLPVEHGHRGHLDETLILGAGDLVEGLTFAIQVGAPISGAVLDANGAPAGGVNVFASESWNEGLGRGAWKGQTRTDAHGAFRLLGAYGDSEVVLRAVSATGMSEDMGPLYVNPDGVTGIELRLTVNTGLVAGTLTSDDGAPVHALLTYSLEGGNVSALSVATTDRQGQFVLLNAPPGTFAIQSRVYRPSGLYQGQGDIIHRGQLAPGQHIRELVLNMAAPPPPITGVLYDEFGAPAAGITVFAEPIADTDVSAMELRTDTDANGAFAFHDVMDAEYEIHVFDPDRILLRAESAQPGDCLELQLVPKSTTAP